MNDCEYTELLAKAVQSMGEAFAEMNEIMSTFVRALAPIANINKEKQKHNSLERHYFDRKIQTAYNYIPICKRNMPYQRRSY